jgi:hypothetical protein
LCDGFNDALSAWRPSFDGLTPSQEQEAVAEGSRLSLDQAIEFAVEGGRLSQGDKKAT